MKFSLSLLQHQAMKTCREAEIEFFMLALNTRK